MCLAESGVLTSTKGEGVIRVGVVETARGAVPVELTYLPDATEGDTILFHSGVGFRIVGADSVTRASGSGSTFH